MAKRSSTNSLAVESDQRPSGATERSPSAVRHFDLQRAAVEHSPDSVLVLDGKGTVLYANRPLPGMREGAILGSSILESMPSSWRSTVSECLQRVVETGRASRFEVELKDPSGRARILESRVSPIQPNGEVSLVVVNTTDVSDRRELESKLRISAERYRFLTDTITDVIWTMDLDQRITYVSPSIRPLTSYSVEEMHMMELREILAPESFALVREILLEELRLEYQPDLEPSRARTVDLKLVRKDGSTVWCEARMSFLRDHRGRPKGVLGVARDISSWREAQEALVATEDRLRRAQRLEAVGQLAGGVAHDFNNLLTVIIGNVELILKELTSGDVLRAQADEISKAADRAAALTRQLLAFSRKQLMMPKVLNLNAVVEDMASMLRGLIGENIELRLDLYPALARVKADPSQIELVLVNLAVNARDAMSEGGRLVIETGNAHLDPRQGESDFTVVEGPYVMLAITDSGKGIDPSDQAKIFEPFFTTKEVGKGTGLGLSTVYGIVKQSGGYIWVTSRPAQGCRFEIYLPRIEADYPVQQQSDEQRHRAVGRETVLLVEDEDSVRALSRRILEDAGYQVVEAPRAGVALEVLEDDAQALDLLVTDVIMPGMSGARLSERAAAMRPNLPVLFMSGHSEEMLTRQAGLDSSTNLLQKPFTPEALMAKVREVLDLASDPA